MSELLTQQQQKMLDNAVVQLARYGGGDKVDTSVYRALQDTISVVKKLQEEHEKLTGCNEVDAQNVSDVYYWLSGRIAGSIAGLPLNQNHLDSMYRARVVMRERAGERE